MKYLLKIWTIALMVTMFTGIALQARDLPVTTIGGRECYVYDVKKGDNIYDVARELKIDTKTITKLNPSAADGLRAGMRLYFPKEILDGDTKVDVAATADNSEPTDVKADSRVNVTRPVVREKVENKVNEEIPSDLPATYTVKKGESLYGISHKFGLTVEQLINMNPSAEYGVSNGQVLVINPAARNETAEVTGIIKEPIDYSLIPSEKRISEQYIVPFNDGEGDDSEDGDEGAMGMETDTVSVAVILPFMLHEGVQNKTAQLFTEFYKGLMLAVDSLSASDDGHHINMYVYDSASSVDTIAAIMQKPELQTVSLIIGPDNETHLQLIADNMPPTAMLYNTFNVRSNLWDQKRNVIQAYIPHTPMIEKAVKEFINIYEGYTPVFVARIDGAADKDAFTSLLKQTLDGEGRKYEEITFRNLLSHRELESLEMDSSYVFVPVSGARVEFAKFSEALRKFGESRTTSSTRVWGYPDWITFRGEYLNRLLELEATIYTRFYYDENEPESQEFNELFKATYGTEMLDAAPVQGVLGFDTGMYLLKLLKDHGKEFGSHLTPFTGLQNVLNFNEGENHGPVNNALMIVTFSPGGRTLKSTIE